MVAGPSGGSRSRAAVTASNLLLEALAGEVTDAIRLTGGRSVLLKGVTTERWLYAGDGRAYGDVDLLVDPTRFDEYERLVAGMGFRRSSIERLFDKGRPRHASTWTRGALELDLHRTLIGLGVSPEEAWMVLSGNTERWTVGLTEVDVLNAPARSLVLALHAAQHGAHFGDSRADLERAIAREPERVWVNAADLARTLRAESSMAAGLLRVDAGIDLCEALGVRRIGATAVEGSASFHAAQGLLWLSELNGQRAKARYLRLKLFPPPSVMHSRVAWSRKGPFALILAYALRLGTTVLYGPRAAWALTALWRERRHP